MTAHVPRALLMSYVLASGMPEDVSVGALWTLEGHVQQCAVCQAEVREVSLTHCPSDTAVMDRVHVRLAQTLPPVRRRRWRRVRRVLARWAAPALGPWVVAVALIVLSASVLSTAAARNSPLLMLLAPAMPLLGVAVSWGPRFDPAHELIAAAPRAGLGLVLRRTCAVLTLVVPALAAAGWITGTAPALVLLPALTLTCAALALGSVVDVERAATALGAAWTLFVVLPTVANGREVPPYLLESTAPRWATAAAFLGVAVVLRRNAYLHPRKSGPRRR
ncbi:hypothetical protein [Streptomyces sulphureus]|uniref:hypothetical protein n=1 Tax=Streptomyces sulphureus TaxID=47758 RepID=UPI0004775D9C|nr:hypothetical protein [Streptomyces sulphureus]